MALPATDNFNRTDNPSLGANWTLNLGTFQVATNQVRCSAGDAAAHWNADTFADDQYSQLVIPAIVAAPYYIGVSVRADASADTYYYIIVAADFSILGKHVAGVNSTLSAGGATAIAGDTLRLEVTGTSLVAKINGSLLRSATDGAIASGYAGLAGQQLGGTYGDNWEGGNIGGGSPTGTSVPYVHVGSPNPVQKRRILLVG